MREDTAFGKLRYRVLGYCHDRRTVGSWKSPLRSCWTRNADGLLVFASFPEGGKLGKKTHALRLPRRSESYSRKTTVLAFCAFKPNSFKIPAAMCAGKTVSSQDPSPHKCSYGDDWFLLSQSMAETYTEYIIGPLKINQGQIDLLFLAEPESKSSSFLRILTLQIFGRRESCLLTNEGVS